MLSQELKEQVFKLPPSDRLALVSAIIESLQDPLIAQSGFTERDRSQAIRRMGGLLKTDQPTPTDAQVAILREERATRLSHLGSERSSQSTAADWDR